MTGKGGRVKSRPKMEKRREKMVRRCIGWCWVKDYGSGSLWLFSPCRNVFLAFVKADNVFPPLREAVSPSLPSRMNTSAKRSGLFIYKAARHILEHSITRSSLRDHSTLNSRNCSWASSPLYFASRLLHYQKLRYTLVQTCTQTPGNIYIWAWVCI